MFFVPFPYKCYIPNLVKIGPLVIEKKTHLAQRQTKNQNSIGHLSDSGDLKSCKIWTKVNQGHTYDKCDYYNVWMHIRPQTIIPNLFVLDEIIFKNISRHYVYRTCWLWFFFFFFSWRWEDLLLQETKSLIIN